MLRRSGTAQRHRLLEVLDTAAPAGAPRQRRCSSGCCAAGFSLTPDNLRIEGGERIRNVGIVWCAPADALPPRPSRLRRHGRRPARDAGDPHRQRRRLLHLHAGLVASSGTDSPPPASIRGWRSIEFSFKVDCPARLRLRAAAGLPAGRSPAPDIDYLAKDYQGFRQLMLDRLALLAPGWKERSRRRSRRHAGRTARLRRRPPAATGRMRSPPRPISAPRASASRCAAMRGWSTTSCTRAATRAPGCISTSTAKASRCRRHTPLLTARRRLPPVVAPGSQRAGGTLLAAGALVFETAHDGGLARAAQRAVVLHLGRCGCCLPPGPTQATLRGHLNALHVGDVLLFEEVASPTTFKRRGRRPDASLGGAADRGRSFSTDPSGQIVRQGAAVDGPVDVTEIAWDARDALPFPLCLSVKAQPGLDISVALGNIVLADHGLTFTGEALGSVPPSTMHWRRRRPRIAATSRRRAGAATLPSGAAERTAHAMGSISPRCSICRRRRREPGGRRAPLLAIDPRTRDAADHQRCRNRQCGDRTVDGSPRPARQPRPTRRDFVVEVETSGRARLRFGDDEHGQRPTTGGPRFAATYRVGNGVAGNVGRGGHRACG